MTTAVLTTPGQFEPDATLHRITKAARAMTPQGQSLFPFLSGAWETTFRLLHAEYSRTLAELTEARRELDQVRHLTMEIDR